MGAMWYVGKMAGKENGGRPYERKRQSSIGGPLGPEVALRLKEVQLRMLRDPQDISIGILEPRHLAAIGRGPNSKLFILGEREFFEHHAAADEPLRNRADVAPRPSQARCLAAA